MRRWDAETGEAIGAPLLGHQGAVLSVASGLVACRAIIVSGGDDGTVRRWDAVTGEAVGEPLVSHKGKVASVALSHVSDRAIIVSVGADGCLLRWDGVTGEAIKQIKQPNRGPEQKVTNCQLTCVATDTVANRTVIACGDTAGRIDLWDAEAGEKIVALFTGYRQINSVAFGLMAGHSYVITSHNDGKIVRWRAEVPAIKERPDGSNDLVEAVAVGTVADRAVVAYSVDTSIVIMRDAETAEQIGPWVAIPPSFPTGLSWVTCLTSGLVAGRAVVVSCHSNSMIRLWDAAFPWGSRLGRLLKFFLNPGIRLRGQQYYPFSVAFGHVAGRPVVASGDWNAIRRWDAETGDAIEGPLLGHEGVIRSINFCLIKGRAIIVSGGDDGTVRRWDAETGEAIGAPLLGHQGDVLSVASGLVAYRAMIVSGGDDGTVRRWEAETGETIGAPLLGHEGKVHFVGFIDEGLRAVIVSAGDDGTVRRRDAETGEVGDIIYFDFPVRAASMSGTRLAIIGDAGGLVVLDLAGSRQRLFAAAAELHT